MIIELYGLPGSGKTSLAREFARKTDFKTSKINRKTELFFYNFLFLIKHPVKFAVTLFYLVLNSKGLKMFYSKFMNSFLHLNAKYQKALGCDKAILDEGYFTNIISIFEREINSKFLKKYLKFLLRPDVLVVFDNANSKERLKRIARRGYGIANYLKEEEKAKWQKITEKNDRTFKKNLNGIPINYIIVDDKKKLTDILKEINKINLNHQ